jgi:hypothetical protein
MNVHHSHVLKSPRPSCRARRPASTGMTGIAAVELLAFNI